MRKIFLNQSQREDFGIADESVEAEIFDWNMARIGVVLGSNGRGGSGVYVKLKNKRLALLTAKHVVLPAVLSGLPTISHTANKKRSFPPAEIKIDRRQDLALLLVPEKEEINLYLNEDEWAPTDQPEIRRGMPVVSCGVPGSLKSEPITSSQTIARTVFLQYWTSVLDPSGHDELIVCDVDKTSNTGLGLKTLGGMSGGPVFNNKKELIGINVMESLGHSSNEELYVLARRRFGNLTKSSLPSDDALSAYVCQNRIYSMRARDVCGEFADFFVTVIVDFFQPKTDPEYVQGQFGCIKCLFFSHAQEDRRIPIAIESLFYLDVSTESELERAVREEMSYVLQGNRFQLKPDLH